MPYITCTVSPSPPREVFPILSKGTLLRAVKIEKLDSIIELSSESEGESPDMTLRTQPCTTEAASQENVSFKLSNTPSNSPAQSLSSRPPLHPNVVDRVSIMECLRRLSSMHQSKNKLSTMELDTVKHHRMQYLPPLFNKNAILNCLLVDSRNIEGMDKRYDGHPWCKLMTTNIHNSDNLKFCKSYCVGHLACQNPECDYLKRASKCNKTEWIGYTTFPFVVGDKPPKDYILVCKIFKVTPSCFNTCDARIYYYYSDNPKMSWATIHFGDHVHPVAKGMYKDSAEKICGLIAEQVAKTPLATNSTIALSASKDFLRNFLFHNGEGEKEMLRSEELEEVMDRFKYLSSPNIQNLISSFHSNNRGGVIDNTLTMKKESKFEYIHDNIFLGQGKEKVYLFKMLTEGPASGVDLVKRMQSGGDLQDGWMMFDHVKRVKEWTTMACHVYDPMYKKVMTIATCDMQFEDTEIQMQFWRSLNAVISRHGVDHPNFKGFMANSAMANWNAVCIVYGSGSANEEMANREKTCLLHWSSSLQKHIQKHIKEAFQQQHTTLCKQYKYSKSMEEAETRYLAIRSWWLSFGATTEDALHHLDH